MIITNEPLLDYFRGRHECELCERRIAYGEPAHPHHALQCRGMGGGSQLDVALNLISACWLCHTKADNLEIIAYREGLLPEHVQEAIWRLLRRSKDARRLG